MFPGARCEGCGARDACAATGALRPEYPRCQTPLRDVSLSRTTALLDRLAASADGSSPAAHALNTAVIERFGRDRGVYSDVLEASFSGDAAGAHLHRFSYAFPGLRADPTGTAATLLRFCEPFGAPIVDAGRTVLRAAASRAVTQILFGFAQDGAGRHRVKLYVQFHPRAGAAAVDLAGRLLGRPVEGAARSAPLHLLCLDLGARGLVGAKLYLVIDRVRLDALPAHLGPVPLLTALGALGVAELCDVLAIHRVGRPGEAQPPVPAEIDFSLPDNDLRWSDVRALPLVEATLARSPEVSALFADFRLAVRRVSASVGSADKLNVYYVLAEPEAAPC